MELCGYAGNILIVNLTDRTVESVPLDPEMAQNYLGGHGINYRLACDFIPPQADPLGPENAIFIGGGPFTGTVVPGSGEVIVSFKSPLTGGVTSGCGGGHFAFMLKTSGYDHLVITGRASSPVFIAISDDEVQIRDADYLWGKKDAYDTVDDLRSKFEPCSVIPIGPAGENLVKISVTSIDKGGSLGTAGFPAVMGSKNLKAIVAQKGSRSVKIADPKRLLRWVDTMLEAIMNYRLRPDLLAGGTHTMVAAWMDTLGMIGKNWSELEFGAGFPGTEIDTIHRQCRKTLACAGCPSGEKDRVDLMEGEYGPMTAYLTDFMMPFDHGAKTVEDDHHREVYVSDLMNRYNICLLNFEYVLSLMHYLYEEGIITKSDTDGLELKDDFETRLKLIHMIAHRQGFGDILADGALEAARKMGKGEEHVLHIKGAMEFIDPRIDTLNTGGFAQLVHHGRPNYVPGGLGIYVPNRPVKSHVQHARRIGMTDEEIDRVFTEVDYNAGRLCKHTEDWYSLFNCFGQCHRLYIHRFHSIEGFTQMYSAITGIEATGSDLLKAGERVWNMGRVLNVRCGFDRKDDLPPAKWFEPLKDKEGNEYPLMDYFRRKVLSRNDVEKWLDDYYDERGWDKVTGIPTEEKLTELGIDTELCR